MSENEYKDWVLADYDRKATAHLLPSELLVPTPGNLKSEGVGICERRFKTKDEILLRSFFNEKEGAAGYRLAIQNSNAEIFKPLTNFLRDRSKGTSLKNIDLLAWLIDFEPRPYHPNLIYSGVPVSPEIKPNPLQPINTGIPQAIQAPPSKRRKKLVIYALSIIAALALGYVAFDHITHRLTGKEGCMYWDDDHYQPIDCNEKPPYGQSQKINNEQVATFRRITKPDTLTPSSVKKVGYIKYNGRIEFFTTSGLYPLDTSRRLLPMTDHILKKYVYHIPD